MALDLNIWIDRLRVFRTVTGPRIEGETRVNKSRSEWLPARIAPSEANEPVTGERPKKVQDIRELTCDLYDPNGVRIEIKKSDRVEIEAGYSGTYTSIGKWEVLFNQIPRNGEGEELLQYLRVVNVEEY